MSRIIGIDLGTTYSAIAQLDDLGNPEVLASTDNNKKITSSAVYIKDENVIVGDKALDALAATPKYVITETKRQMENDAVYSVETGEWIDKDENNHLIIKAGTWFSMKSNGKYSLIGCTVAPAFDYKDFELAPPKWSPG